MHTNKKAKRPELEFWDRVASIYDERVILHPPPMMHEYELWEDEQLDLIMWGMIENKTIFLEIGSGTGRYLTRYGKQMLEKPEFSANLLAIVGIDFSEEMIRKSIINLKAAHLEKLIGRRIFLVRADATNPPISFKKPGLNAIQKIVAIMFGTIGNIKKGRQNLLRYLCSNLLNTNGIGVISFFNRHALTAKGGGLEDYSLIPEIVGTPLQWNPKNGIVTTGKKFFTEWFEYETFAKQIESVNLEIIQRLEGPGPKVPKVFRLPLWSKVPRGYIVTVAPKNCSLRETVNRISKNEKISISPEKLFQKMLVCPKCRPENSDTLVFKSTEISCRQCGTRFPIKSINGVRVPDFLKTKKV